MTIVLSFWLILFMQSPDARIISFQECLQAGLNHSPGLQANRSTVEQAVLQSDLEGDVFSPQVLAGFSTGYIEGLTVSPYTAVKPFTDEGFRSRKVSGIFGIVDLSVRVPLIAQGVTPFQETPSQKWTRFGETLAEGMLKNTEQQVVFEIGLLYLQLVVQEKLTLACHDQERLLDSHREAAKIKFTQELLSRNDLLKAEMDFARSAYDVIASQAEVQRLRNVLSRRMGLSEGTSWTVEDVSLPVDTQKTGQYWLGQALANRPEIEVLKTKIARIDQEILVISRAAYPTLDFSTSYSLGHDFRDRDTSFWRTTLDVQLPLFHWSNTRTKKQIARKQAAQAKAELDTLEQQVNDEVMIVTAALKTATAAEEYHRIAFQQAEENLRLMRGKAGQSLANPSEVIEAEIEQIEAYKKLLLSRHDVVTTQWQLLTTCAVDMQTAVTP